jgi:hypothetical protein
VSMNEYLDIPDAYWSLPLDELLLDLKFTKDGLTGDEARKRFNAIGPNSLVEKRQDSLLSLLFRQFKSPIILILLFVTLVSGILKDWTDAVIILLIVLGNVILSLIQEYSADSPAFTRSRPSRAMLAVTGMVALVTIMLPYSPLAGILGFQALPLRTLMTMSIIVIVYFLAAELTKRWFFKRFLS